MKEFSMGDLTPRPDESEDAWIRRLDSIGLTAVRMGGFGGVDDMKAKGIPHQPPFVTKDVAESRAIKNNPEPHYSSLARELAQVIQSEDMQGSKKMSPMSFVLDDAKDIVYGPREHLYGHASVNFRRVARLWEVIFGAEVSAMQVGLAMIQMKVSRLQNLVERENQGGAAATFAEVEDGFKDIAGYAEATMRALYERPDGSRTK